MLAEEPKKMGTRVSDVNGHVWVRGRTRWTCEAKVGTRYFDTKAKRTAVVEQVARLPWYALTFQYGPLSDDDG